MKKMRLYETWQNIWDYNLIKRHNVMMTIMMMMIIIISFNVLCLIRSFESPHFTSRPLPCDIISNLCHFRMWKVVVGGLLTQRNLFVLLRCWLTKLSKPLQPVWDPIHIAEMHNRHLTNTISLGVGAVHFRGQVRTVPDPPEISSSPHLKNCSWKCVF